METFRQQYRAGSISATDIDDFIDAWHQADSLVSLADFLGMTTADYEAWLKDPNALLTIVSPSLKK